MLPNLDHLYWIRHDTERFEAERKRLIAEYIASVPEEHRAKVQAYQNKIDGVRGSLTAEQFLAWTQLEVQEMAANLSDQFLAISHKANDIKASLRSVE